MKHQQQRRSNVNENKVLVLMLTET
jgi:hypothetical protein